MAYYTEDEWIQMLQAKLGTYIGTDNKRFSPDRCDAALRQTIRMWQPLMPVDFQDNYTEFYDTAQVWNSGDTTFNLRSNVARLVGVDIPGYTVELYGVGREGMDYNAWVDNKNSRSDNLANARVFLVCYSGKRLMIAPTPASNLPFNVLVRYYPAWPGNTTETIYVPETTIPFHLAQAASLGKWGDLRPAEAQALQNESLTLLKSVFSIQDREAEQSK
jgi:hypothetical protein